MKGVLSQILGVLAPSAWLPEVVGPGKPQVIGPAAPTLVDVPYRQAWDEKRWTRNVTTGAIEFSGMYRVFDKRALVWREFHGRLVQQDNRIAAYIADPPPEIQKHPKAPCLQLVRAPWFRLHWAQDPKTLDQALLYMERILDESINRGRRR